MFADLKHLIPHFLSLSRVVAALLMWINPSSSNFIIACIMWGAMSDWVDGYLARRWHVTSRLGAMLDPIGDKIFIGSLVTLLYFQGKLPLWWMMMVLGRDGLILIGGIIANRFYGVKDMPPTWISKINTALQLLVLLMAVWPLSYIDFMMVLVSLTTIASGAQYAKFFGHVVTKRVVL